MKNEWDDYALDRNVDPRVDKYASMAFLSLTKIVKLEGLSVLDFGCGTGALTQLISPKVSRVVAIDPAPKMIYYLDNKALTNVFSIADFLSESLINNHPLLEHKFDLIVASSVCAFLPDYEATLGLLISLLKKKGTLVQWDWLAEDDASVMGLSENRVKRVFEAHTFKVSNISTPFVMGSSKGEMLVLIAYGKQE